jgi:hypothetical protein
MRIQHESAAPAPAPALAAVPSHKLLRLLRTRLRQLLRVTIVLAIGLALGATGLAIWWLISLNRLPDIGDPFDVAAFRGLRVPVDQNAFTYLQRAAEKLTEFPDLPRAVGPAAPTIAWSKADPKVRAWVEENRQALELFLQAAEQSDAILHPGGDPLTYSNSGVNPGELNVLALLEGSKRQESGDTAGAWECYRAVLRTTAQINRRGCLQTTRANFGLTWLRQRLPTWAADPRTTIPQLQTALDEVLKTEAAPDWDSFGIKMGYLDFMRSLERPMNPYVQQEIEGEWTYRLSDMQLPLDMIETFQAARRFLLREPERSRRVARLLCANWLAHVETLELRPQKPAVLALLPALNPIRVSLYPVHRDAPAGARALPPQEVASWLVTTQDAKLQILEGYNSAHPWPPNLHVFRRARAALVITLATEIYRRERGALPPSEEALVGTYLKTLPDDGSADLADEMTPTVE